MPYWTYYLLWSLLVYAARQPWLLAGIVALVLLRRFIPDPGALWRAFGRMHKLRTQVEVNAADVIARRDLAVLYLDLRRPRAALPVLDQALARTPDDAELLYLQGLALQRSGQHQKALAPLVRAVELDSRIRFGLPYRVAGDALMALERYESAVDAYEQYVESNSSDVSGYTQLARALMRMGDTEAAQRQLKEGLRTFRILPGGLKRRSFGQFLHAHWVQAFVLREPGALTMFAVLFMALLFLGVGLWRYRMEAAELGTPDNDSKVEAQTPPDAAVAKPAPAAEPEWRKQARVLLDKHADSLPVGRLLNELRPSLRLSAHRVTLDQLALGASRFGGVPDMPADVSWPSWPGSHRDGRNVAPGIDIPPQNLPATPLGFLAQIQLSGLADVGLPRSGWLLFFYDVRNVPWGIDPKDRGAFQVLYVPAGQTLVRAQTPQALGKEYVSEPCALESKLEATLPDQEPRLSEQQQEEYFALQSELAGGHENQVFNRMLGWPQLVQGEMTQEVQLLANGIDPEDDSLESKTRAATARGSADDWVLLLQLDSDDAPGWMWEDAGRIYFWIRKQDLAARRFDNIWLMLQCG